jgi:hypothetical protein
VTLTTVCTIQENCWVAQKFTKTPLGLRSSVLHPTYSFHAEITSTQEHIKTTFWRSLLGKKTAQTQRVCQVAAKKKTEQTARWKLIINHWYKKFCQLFWANGHTSYVHFQIVTCLPTSIHAYLKSIRLRPNWCGFSFDRKIGASYTSGRAQEGSVQVPIWRHAGASETVRFLVWFRAKASSCSGSDWEAPTLRKSWCGSGLDPCQPGKQCGKVLGPLRSESITRLFGIGFGGSPFPRISLNCQSCKALNSKPFFKQ